MMIMMNELPYDACNSIYDIFLSDDIKMFREKYVNNCYGVAEVIKDSLNKSGYLAEIITFKNGNAFLDGGIKVSNHTYTHHTIVLMGEWIIDVLHTDDIVKTKDYILELQKLNPKLRIDYTMSTCWYTNDGFPYKPSIQNLLEYKY